MASREERQYTSDERGHLVQPEQQAPALSHAWPLWAPLNWNDNQTRVQVLSQRQRRQQQDTVDSNASYSFADMQQRQSNDRLSLLTGVRSQGSNKQTIAHERQQRFNNGNSFQSRTSQQPIHDRWDTDEASSDRRHRQQGHHDCHTLREEGYQGSRGRNSILYDRRNTNEGVDVRDRNRSTDRRDGRRQSSTREYIQLVTEARVRQSYDNIPFPQRAPLAAADLVYQGSRVEARQLDRETVRSAVAPARRSHSQSEYCTRMAAVLVSTGGVKDQ